MTAGHSAAHPPFGLQPFDHLTTIHASISAWLVQVAGGSAHPV